MAEDLNTHSNLSHTNRSNSAVSSNGNWSDTIRTIFIYGTGALRFQATRTPHGRFVVIGGTVLGDSIAKTVSNAINNPNYIKDHVEN
jgi:hypothetical protein